MKQIILPNQNPIADLSSSIERWGYTMEIEDEIEFALIRTYLTLAGIKVSVEQVIDPYYLEEFEVLLNALRGELDRKGISTSFYLGTNRLRPIYLKGPHVKEATLIGCVTKDDTLYCDLSVIMPLGERLRQLRKNWNKPVHEAFQSIEFLADEYIQSLVPPAYEDNQTFIAQALVHLDNGYGFFYKIFAEQKALMDVDLLTTQYYTFSHSNAQVIEENEALVEGLYSGIYRIILNALADRLDTERITQKHWGKVDLESIKMLVHESGFTLNGVLGRSGAGLLENLDVQESGVGKILLSPNLGWKKRLYKFRQNNVSADMVRYFISMAAPLNGKVITLQHSLGFEYGKNGACPVAGKNEDGDHAYDILTDFGYNLIKRLLEQ